MFYVQMLHPLQRGRSRISRWGWVKHLGIESLVGNMNSRPNASPLHFVAAIKMIARNVYFGAIEELVGMKHLGDSFS
ncbi:MULTISPECIES: hypothetical protein [unclassified Microcoleus]|uniref:hypothetical protein n=1 Tax=unclassified Microcoleus TaxID=2642155 RepID=UPI0025E809CF|nr:MULTISPECIES: hypothetical protein [unclassified Microcoleus]